MTVYLALPGNGKFPYPNGGDEAYWMGQVTGALASRLNGNGIPLEYRIPEQPGPGDFRLALFSQTAPPDQEGQKKGPVLLYRRGDGQGKRGAEILAAHLGRVYPQPELVQVREEPCVEALGGDSLPGVAVQLLYRDNPQDEAWLTRQPGAVAQALARGLAEVLGAPYRDA